jgi:hypothetical protein
LFPAEEKATPRRLFHKGEEKTGKTKKQKSEQPISMIPRTSKYRYHDTKTIFPLVRKAVRELVRLQLTAYNREKKAIADIMYTYQNNGIKTSENQITRISVNFIIEDYRQNGENSILHKILKALNE